jgi:hypothetical protein
MNKKIDDFITQLDEKFRTAFNDADYNEVFENPSKKEVQDLPSYKKYKEAKIIIHKNGTIYVWGPEDPAFHEIVEHQLGIQPRDSLRLYYLGKRKEIQGFNMGGMGSENPELAWDLLEKSIPQLKQLFGAIITNTDF